MYMYQAINPLETVHELSPLGGHSVASQVFLIGNVGCESCVLCSLSIWSYSHQVSVSSPCVLGTGMPM